jgi:hypothetical protein
MTSAVSHSGFAHFQPRHFAAGAASVTQKADAILHRNERRVCAMKRPPHCNKRPGWFRLKSLPGGACAHRKAPPFHGVRRQQPLALPHADNQFTDRRSVCVDAISAAIFVSQSTAPGVVTQ